MQGLSRDTSGELQTVGRRASLRSRSSCTPRGTGSHRAALLLCGDHHLAEDLTQTTYAKVYAAWSTGLARPRARWRTPATVLLAHVPLPPPPAPLLGAAGRRRCPRRRATPATTDPACAWTCSAALRRLLAAGPGRAGAALLGGPHASPTPRDLLGIREIRPAAARAVAGAGPAPHPPARPGREPRTTHDRPCASRMHETVDSTPHRPGHSGGAATQQGTHSAATPPAGGRRLGPGGARDRRRGGGRRGRTCCRRGAGRLPQASGRWAATTPRPSTSPPHKAPEAEKTPVRHRDRAGGRPADRGELYAAVTDVVLGTGSDFAGQSPGADSAATPTASSPSAGRRLRRRAGVGVNVQRPPDTSTGRGRRARAGEGFATCLNWMARVPGQFDHARRLAAAHYSERLRRRPAARAEDSAGPRSVSTPGGVRAVASASNGFAGSGADRWDIRSPRRGALGTPQLAEVLGQPRWGFELRSRARLDVLADHGGPNELPVTVDSGPAT